ncbi:MAG TPA: DUF2795 domain-containing protein [Actinomycetota bacterium]|nr:DUF2795 domain-containing protein [Actinomycetota bacterium]
MIRDTTKHGSQMDEQMGSEVDAMHAQAGTESRADEARLTEDAVDRRLPDGRPGGVEERSTIARFLRPSTFPADKQALIRDAAENHALDWVQEDLQSLPEGRQFQNVEEVWEALGGPVERRF